MILKLKRILYTYPPKLGPLNDIDYSSWPYPYPHVTIGDSDRTQKLISGILTYGDLEMYLAHINNEFNDVVARLNAAIVQLEDYEQDKVPVDHLINTDNILDSKLRHSIEFIKAYDTSRAELDALIQAYPNGIPFSKLKKLAFTKYSTAGELRLKLSRWQEIRDLEIGIATAIYATNVYELLSKRHITNATAERLQAILSVYYSLAENAQQAYLEQMGFESIQELEERFQQVVVNLETITNQLIQAHARAKMEEERLVFAKEHSVPDAVRNFFRGILGY